MHEVVQAAKRAMVQVETVFAMHQAPMPWNQVVSVGEKAQHPPSGAGWAAGPAGTFKHFQMRVLDLIHRHRQREKDIHD